MRTALRAMAWTRQFGVRGVIDQLIEDGLTEVHPPYAQPGDILLATTDDGQYLPVMTPPSEGGEGQVIELMRGDAQEIGMPRCQRAQHCS